ncbi:MAG TPA: carbohydrate binding domain-containing protein [Blastocatellia bacterium]|nr:carbohydrate binding domain-containing protein [Blastocatellia bacterium]
MLLTIPLHKPLLRLLALALAVALGLSLGWLIYLRLLVSAVTAKKSSASLATLAATVTFLPQSARVQARFADVLLSQAPDEETLTQAEMAAEQAVHLSPYNAKYRLLLAAAKGLRGETEAQEAHLRAALALAPHNTQMHWRLANALLRAGKMEAALAEFRGAVTADPALLPVTLELLWQLTEGDVETLLQAAGETSKNRLQLTQFLLKQSRVNDALRLIGTMNREERLVAPEVSGVLQELMTAGKVDLAHQLWMELMTTGTAPRPLLWNGSFEDASPPHLSQFEWQLRGNEYAQLTLDSYIAHSGAKSLRLDFFGRDTTRLSKEIQQLIVVRPGVRYRLTCFVRTSRLVTPEGPRIVVTTSDTAQTIAATNPINGVTSEWQAISTDFTAPTKSSALLVSVQRVPKADYDDPTQGTIWFDDFTLTEIR